MIGPSITTSEMKMRQVYSIKVTQAGYTTHIIGQLVDYRRSARKMAFVFRFFDRCKPYQIVINADNLSNAIIRPISGYDPCCF